MIDSSDVLGLEGGSECADGIKVGHVKHHNFDSALSLFHFGIGLDSRLGRLTSLFRSHRYIRIIYI